MIPKNAKPGDFVLVHEGGQFGWTVNTLQAMNGDGFGDFEHIALYAGTDFIIEMASSGIRTDNVNKYNNTKTLWSSGRIINTPDQQSGIVRAARSYLAAHIGYSWPDYGALVAHRLHLPFPGLQHYISDTKHMICSQFIDQCYSDAGVHLFRDGRWPGYVTPGDLYQLLQGYQDNEA